MAKAEKEEDRYSLGSVPTETASVIVDAETDEKYTVDQTMVIILNKLEKIEKSVSG